MILDAFLYHAYLLLTSDIILGLIFRCNYHDVTCQYHFSLEGGTLSLTDRHL